MRQALLKLQVPFTVSQLFNVGQNFATQGAEDVSSPYEGSSWTTDISGLSLLSADCTRGWDLLPGTSAKTSSK